MKVFANRLKRLTVLSDAAAQAVADAVVRTHMVASGVDIVSAGLPASECHVLLGGLAAPYKLLRDGRRQIVRFAFPGDLVDLDAFICSGLDYSVACKVGVTPHPVLHDLSAAHPKIITALWRHTLADAAILREWVVNVGQRSAQERVAHIICEVFLHLQEAGLAIEISGNKTFSWQFSSRSQHG